MSGFKQSGLIVSEKDTPVDLQNPGEVSIVARDNRLKAYDGIVEKTIANDRQLSISEILVELSNN